MNQIKDKLEMMLRSFRDDDSIPKTITADMTLMGDIGLSSLELVLLICSIESEFSIEIPLEDAEKLVTAGDMIYYLEQRLPK